MNKKLIFFIILVIVVLLIGFWIFKPRFAGKNNGPEPALVQPITEQGSINIYFCPYQNCSVHLIDALEQAQASIDCGLYDMNLRSVADVLSKKAGSMPVRIVFDNDNEKHVQDLNSKFSYKFDNDNQLSHNKFCVIDNRLVTTGSMNPTLRDDQMNNNNLLILQSQYFAQNYEDEFQELWAGKFGTGSKVRYPDIVLNGIHFKNYFCPEDKCEQHVIDTISHAHNTVYFMTFSFTSVQIADAILTNKQLTDVKGIFEKSQLSKYSQYERLKGFGLDVKIDGNKYNLHHKVFIIDNETVITGSYNPTTGGDEKNDENIVIIHDKNIARMYLEDFGKVYSLGT